MGTFGQPFFCLHHPPFNTSFNTPFNARLPYHLVAHERHPFNPSEPHRHTQQPHHAHHIADVSKMMQPATRTAHVRKPQKARYSAFHTLSATIHHPQQKEPPGAPFLAVMPSGSLPFISPASEVCPAHSQTPTFCLASFNQIKPRLNSN